MNIKTYIAPSAVVTGDVVLENNVNIWHCAVLRGDSGQIFVKNIPFFCLVFSFSSAILETTDG